MSFWMRHSRSYELASEYARSRFLAALISGGVMIITTSNFVFLVVYIFNGLKFNAEVFGFGYIFLEPMLLLLLCGRVEVFRKLYEGLRLYPEMRHVIRYTLGTKNIYKYWW